MTPASSSDGVVVGRCAVIAAVLSAGLLWGCPSGTGTSPAGNKTASAEPGPFPPLVLRGPIDEAMKARIDAAWSSASARPAEVAAAGELAMLLHALDQLSAALTYYRRCAQLAPADFRWHHCIGLVCEASGDESGAATAFADALARKRIYAPAGLRLARIRMARELYQQAFELCDQAIGFAPENPYAYLGAGQALLKLGQPGAAAQQASFALGAVSRRSGALREFAAAYELLAAAMDAQGKTDAATKARAAALRHEGRNPPFPDPVLEDVLRLGRDEPKSGPETPP